MRDDDRDDDQPLTQDEIAAQYGWQSEAERAASYAEVAERRRKLDMERALAEAYAAAEARKAAPQVETKSAPAKRAHVNVSAPSASMTREWQSYIARQLDKRDRSMAKAVAQVLLAEEKSRIAEVAALRTRVDELQERLDQIETAPRSGLRAV